VLGAAVVLLSTMIFALALGAHETLHLVVIHALGSQGSLVIRPWRLGLADFYVYGLHAQPDQPLGLLRQTLVNLLGPVLAAVPLAVLLAYVREPVLRSALIANLAILAFYALIEVGYVWLEDAFNVELAFLTTPEFNYGIPALIVFAAAWGRVGAARRAREGAVHLTRRVD
jgi:hypothetical protein